MVLPYGGRVGWRRIMKAVMIYIVTAFFIIVKRVPFLEPAFFYLIILTKPIFPYIRCIFNEVMEKIG